TLNLPGTALLHNVALDRGLDGPTDSGISCYLRFGQFFAVAGRVYGLSLVSFQPAGNKPGHPLQAEVSTAGGHIFDVAAVLDQSIDTSTTPLTVAAEVDTLPADVKLSMDSLAGPAPSYQGMKLDYQGSDSSGGPASIGRIEAYA